MASIAAALGRIKRDLGSLLDQASIEEACRRAGHTWRECELDPAATLTLFARQVLGGNTAIGALRHEGGLRVSESAYCQARQRLPAEALRTLARDTGKLVMGQRGGEGLWHGHRALLADGSGCSMPDTPGLAGHYGYPSNQKPGCGFPVAHLLVQFDAGSGAALHLLDAPQRTHDLPEAVKLLDALEANDLVVGDGAFCSYAHLALLRGRGCHGLFRAPLCLVRALGLPLKGPLDRAVCWQKPKKRPGWMSKAQWDALPPSLELRVVRYRIDRRVCRCGHVTLLTTLLHPRAYRVSDLAGLFASRWDAETNLRHLKQTLGMNVLRCKSVEGVRKEMLVFMLIYNLVRLVMVLAARRQGCAPGEVSFIDAWRWLRQAGDGRPLIELKLNPWRPGRVEPRVLKRRPHPRTYMTQPRDVLRKRLRAEFARLT